MGEESGLRTEPAPQVPAPDVAASTPAAPGAPLQSLASALGNHALTGLARSASRSGGAAVVPEPVVSAGDLGLQRALARAVLAREPEEKNQSLPEDEGPPLSQFQPVLSTAVLNSTPVLGSTVIVGVRVENRDSAPEGAQFAWSWGAVDQKMLRPPIGPMPAAAEAELSAQVTSAGTTTVAPELSYSLPDPAGNVSGPPITVPAGPITITVPQPGASFGELEVKAGPRVPDRPRDKLNVYVGDTVTVRATMSQVEKPEEAGVTGRIGNVGTAAPAGRWADATTYEWTWTQENSGDFAFDASILAPGADGLGEQYTLTAYTDLLQWALSCETALHGLSAQYDAAVTKLDGAAEHLDGAIKAFHDSMEGKAKVDKDRAAQTELLLNFLLVGAGAMGAGAIKIAMNPAKKALEEGLTVAAGDTFKFATRVYGQMLGMGVRGIVSPTPPGGSAAAGDASKEMKDLSLQIRAEKDNVTANIAGLMNAARLAAVKQPDALVSLDDPLATIQMNDALLSEAAALPGKPRGEFLKQLWHDWLPRNAAPYMQFEYINTSFDDGFWAWRIEDFIRKGAAECGESEMDWAVTYIVPTLHEDMQPLARREAKGSTAKAAP